MDTALSQKFPFILDRNLAKANCTENRVFTSCDTVVLEAFINETSRYHQIYREKIIKVIALKNSMFYDAQ